MIPTAIALIGPMILGAIISHFIEYTFFAPKEERLRLTFTKQSLYRTLLIWLILSLFAFFIVVLIANFVYGWLFSNKIVNTTALLFSGIISSFVAISWILRYMIRRKTIVRPNRSIYIFNQWWMLSWPILLIFTSVTSAASPQKLVLVLPFGDNENANSIFVDESSRFLSKIGRKDITIRNFDCFGSCPLPDKALDDPRVQLVVTGAIVKDESNNNQIEVTFYSRCRRDIDYISDAYQPERSCRDGFSFPFDSTHGIRYLDVYVPIFFLSTLASTGTDTNIITMVNSAIQSLHYTTDLADRTQQRQLHEKLFYDFLYNTPNLRQEERLSSAGEVIKSMKGLDVDESAINYMLGRWYEESGIIDSANYEQAVKKYQSLLLDNPEDAHLLLRLGIVSSAMNRPVDAVCYLVTSNELDREDNKRMLIANLYEKIGYKPSVDTNTEIDSLTENPSELRKPEQLNDPTSVEEFLSLGESALADRSFDKALTWARRASSSSNASSTQKARAYFLIGRIKYDKSDTDGAVQAFNELVEYVTENKLRPDTILAAHDFLAVAYHSRGLHEQASETYQKELQYTTEISQRAEINAKIAQEEAFSGNIASARRYFKEANDYYDNIDIKVAPENQQQPYVDMLYDTAFLEENEAKKKELFTYVSDYYSTLINNAIETAKTDYQGCYWLESTLKLIPDGAFDHLENYVQKPLLPADYYKKRRFANENIGNTDELISDIRNEINRRESTSITAADYYNLGLAYMEINEYLKVIEAMQKAIDLDSPGNAEDIADATDYYEQGLAYMNIHDNKNAISTITKAIELQMRASTISAAVYWSSLGDVYINNKEYKKAADAYEQAKNNRSPEDSQKIGWDWSHIGQAYQQLGLQLKSKTELMLAIDSYSQAERILVNSNSRAGVWFDIGTVNRNIASIDHSADYYQKAIDAWHRAIDLDNPEQTQQGSDSRDIADYIKIAEVYKDWSAIDPLKIDMARDAISRAISIPILPEDGDYFWHQRAEALKEELEQKDQ